MNIEPATSSSPGRSTTPSPKRILFANSKGGCGKSTLATNLASYYAHKNIATALLDYDPQGSSSEWLRRRSPHAAPISGISAFENPSAGSTRNWFMRIPRDTHRVIVDTPAGLQRAELAEQVKLADLIIVPVLPSPIDIHAATRFISSVLLSGQFRHSGKQLLVLANRIKKNTRALIKLDRFLDSLKLPQTGSIRDTQNYIYSYDMGMGIVDLPPSRSQADLQEWHDLVAWIELQLHCNRQVPTESPRPATAGKEIKQEIYTVL